MHQNNLKIFLAIIGSVLIVPALIGYAAAPTAEPPAGNVDANFSSVTAGYGSTAPTVGGDFSGSSVGVKGTTNTLSGLTYGVYGHSASTSGIGVYGLNNATSGPTSGVYGRSASTSGYGVSGLQ
jgi:hypothetical protein